MESDVAQQSVDMPHPGQDSKAQGSEVDESLSRSRLGLTRMDQTVVTESNRPMYPPPGHDDPKHVTGIIRLRPRQAIQGHQNMSRRPVPGRRRTLSQTSTAAPLPLEDGSNRSLDLDTDRIFREQAGQGHRNSRHAIIREKCWDLLTPLRRCQVFHMKSGMLQSSLSIATECWTCKDDLQSTENAVIHRKSIMQNFWWKRGTI